jgi:hypothetical protein
VILTATLIEQACSDSATIERISPTQNLDKAYSDGVVGERRTDR